MSLNYKISPLNEVCSEIIDCVNKTAPVVDYETPYKMIRTTNVKKGYIDVDTVRYVTKRTFEKWTRRAKPKRNDIVLTREAPLGEIGLLRSDDNIFLGQRLIQYRANKKVIDQHYLYYAFQDSFMQGQIKSYGSGATVEHLRIGDCETIKVKYPSLPAQKKIASILSAYDDLIENNNQRIQLLEEMAEEIYKEWFVRLRFPGYQDSKFFDKKGIEVPLGTVGALPEGWEELKIKDVFNTSSGGTPSRKNESFYNNGNINWVKTKELLGSFVFSTEEKITETGLKNSSTKLFPANTILMGMYGGVYGEGKKSTLGQLGILTEPSTTNQACCAFLVKDNLYYSYPYLFMYLKSKQVEFLNMSMGSAQQNISQEIIRNSKYISPTSILIQEFDAIVKPFLEEIKILLQKNQVLQETRDLLLPRLISGKLNVDDLEGENNPINAMAAEPEEAYKS